MKFLHSMCTYKTVRYGNFIQALAESQIKTWVNAGIPIFTVAGTIRCRVMRFIPPANNECAQLIFLLLFSPRYGKSGTTVE